jgi:hypothetical protein
MRSMSAKSEKWAVGILAVVSVALLVRLVFYNGVTAGAAHPTAPRASSAAARAHLERPPAAREAAQARDPGVDWGLFENLQKRPLPELARNPFEFPPPPAPKRSAAGPGQPAPPPPPPPLPLHAIGYSEQSGQPPQAVITDDEDIYVVHAGDTFAKRFKVLSLTPARVEVHDAVTQQTVQLPIGP